MKTRGQLPHLFYPEPTMQRRQINSYAFPMGFDPLSLSPYVWYDASDATTLYNDVSGGSLVAANGLIARWEDKSGNGRHLSDVNPYAQPTRKTAIQNGLDVVSFDGVNNFLATTSFSASQFSEMFVVVKAISTPVGYIIHHEATFVTGRVSLIAFNNELYSNQLGASGVSTYTSKIASMPTGSFKLVSSEHGSTNAQHILRINSAIPTINNDSANNPGIYTKPSVPFAVGGESAFANTLEGYIGEILYTPTLSESQRNSTHSYLMTKWGV